MIVLDEDLRCEDIRELKSGVKIIIRDRDGKIKIHTIKEILNPGTGREEVLLKIKKNFYFIWSMYINRESWASDVWVLSFYDKQVTK